LFDTALSINSVQLWLDSRAGVEEMQHVLRPGGLITIALQPVWVRKESEVRKLGEELVTLSALLLPQFLLCPFE